MAWSQPYFSILSNHRKTIAADPKMKIITDLCIASGLPNHNYFIHDQILFWKSRIVNPTTSVIV